MEIDLASGRPLGFFELRFAVEPGPNCHSYSDHYRYSDRDAYSDGQRQPDPNPISHPHPERAANAQRYPVALGRAHPERHTWPQHHADSESIGYAR